jgi:hypothetical protein
MASRSGPAGWSVALICTAIVAAGAIGARVIATASWNSVVDYHTPYVLQPRTPFGTRLVDRVMLVVLDGLRLDQSREMPEINELRAVGADGVSRVGLPSLSNPARAVMATGSWQEVNGVTNNSHYVPPTGRNIFSNANAVGLRVALATIDFWHDNYGVYARENFARFPKEPHDQGPAAIAAYQHDLCDGITAFVRGSQARLLVVDLTAVDIISHDIGPLTDGASQVRAEVNACLGRVVKSVDLAKTVVIVTSDHGHIDTGGHGGDEPEVMKTPLVIAGQNVRHTSDIVAQQVDIAPTICGLLGIPVPSMNQGNFLAEAFDFPEDTVREVRLRVTQQRFMFDTVQKRILGGDRDTAPQRASRLRLGPVVGTSLLILSALGWIIMAACQGTRERLGLASSLVFYYAIYWLLFHALHLGYSLSVVNREEFLSSFLFKGMLISAIAAGSASHALFWSWLGGDRTWASAARLVAAFHAVVCLLWMAEVVRLYYLNGITISAWMFDLTMAFTCYLDLLALIGLPLGLLAGILVVGVPGVFCQNRPR